MDGLFRRKKPLVPIRALHLDLKGLPPTPDRLVGLLRVAKLARYNAVLVEWEDTFPWTCDKRFRGETWYRPQTVAAFHDEAARLSMDVIPLVQCLGHMETPLQLEAYAALREEPGATDCLNPLAPGADALVRAMVDNVLGVGPTPRYFHLGGDEAWRFGRHPDTRAYIEKHGKAALYLRHIEPILRDLNGRGIRPILWHDMMKDWPEDALRRLGQMCDLMVWGYTGTPDTTPGHHRREIIARFAAADVPMWGGSAFKPGQGTGDNLADPGQRLVNNVGWVKTAREFGFRGVCATGWSRGSTPNVQYMPIDANLDVLIACGVVLHDGVPPAGGLGACADALAELGEADRFRKRREAVAAFEGACAMAWRHLRNLSQYIALQRTDPTRRPSGVGLVMAEGARDALKCTEEAGRALIPHFRGLVPPVWIKRLAASRTAAIAAVLKPLVDGTPEGP